MGMARISFIYGSVQDFDIRQLWEEMAPYQFFLTNPENGKIERILEDGDSIISDPESLEHHFREEGLASFNLWYKPEPGESMFCSPEKLNNSILKEYYGISSLRHSEETRHITISALLNRAIRKARRNSLSFFSLDFSGGCEDLDIDAVAGGNMNELKVIPEILGVTKLSAQWLQPSMRKLGFQQFQVGPIVFFHLDPLPNDIEITEPR
jgi:hypothetical protein